MIRTATENIFFLQLIALYVYVQQTRRNVGKSVLQKHYVS